MIAKRIVLLKLKLSSFLFFFIAKWTGEQNKEKKCSNASLFAFYIRVYRVRIFVKCMTRARTHFYTLFRELFFNVFSSCSATSFYPAHFHMSKFVTSSTWSKRINETILFGKVFCFPILRILSLCFAFFFIIIRNGLLDLASVASFYLFYYSVILFWFVSTNNGDNMTLNTIFGSSLCRNSSHFCQRPTSHSRA